MCTVLGWVAYACGQGALAAVAVDRALRVEPGYSMALLLEHAMDQMIPPEVVRAVAARAG